VSLIRDPLRMLWSLVKFKRVLLAAPAANRPGGPASNG